MGRGWKNVGKPGIKSLNCLQWIGHRNLDFRDGADRVQK